VLVRQRQQKSALGRTLENPKRTQLSGCGGGSGHHCGVRLVQTGAAVACGEVQGRGQRVNDPTARKPSGASTPFGWYLPAAVPDFEDQVRKALVRHQAQSFERAIGRESAKHEARKAPAAGFSTRSGATFIGIAPIETKERAVKWARFLDEQLAGGDQRWLHVIWIDGAVSSVSAHDANTVDLMVGGKTVQVSFDPTQIGGTLTIDSSTTTLGAGIDQLPE